MVDLFFFIMGDLYLKLSINGAYFMGDDEYGEKL